MRRSSAIIGFLTIEASTVAEQCLSPQVSRAFGVLRRVASSAQADQTTKAEVIYDWVTTDIYNAAAKPLFKSVDFSNAAPWSEPLTDRLDRGAHVQANHLVHCAISPKLPPGEHRSSSHVDSPTVLSRVWKHGGRHSRLRRGLLT